MFSPLRSTFGGSPKFISKWLYADEKELKAVNDGWQLVREEGNHRYLYMKQVSLAATVGHIDLTKKQINTS